MRKLLLALPAPLAGLALIILAGCANDGSVSDPNAKKALDTISQGLTAVANSCRAIQPTVDAVPGAMQSANASAQAQAQNILAYQKSVCGSTSAMAAVVAANPSGAGATATWVSALGTGLITALPQILQATGAIKH